MGIPTIVECIRSGRHLASCDDDGYCQECGDCLPTTPAHYSKPAGLRRPYLYTTTPCHSQRAVFNTSEVIGRMRSCKLCGFHWEVTDIDFDDETKPGQVCWEQVD